MIQGILESSFVDIYVASYKMILGITLAGMSIFLVFVFSLYLTTLIINLVKSWSN